MRLYIGNNAYNARNPPLIFYGEAETYNDLIALCNKYLDKHNYNKNKYWRWICEKNPDNTPLWIIDFGSWSRFFYITDLNGKLLEDWIKLSKGNIK